MITATCTECGAKVVDDEPQMLVICVNCHEQTPVDGPVQPIGGRAMQRYYCASCGQPFTMTFVVSV